MLASPSASAAKTQSTIIETRRAAKESAMISSMVCAPNIMCSLLISFNAFRMVPVVASVLPSMRASTPVPPDDRCMISSGACM